MLLLSLARVQDKEKRITDLNGRSWCGTIISPEDYIPPEWLFASPQRGINFEIMQIQSLIRDKEVKSQIIVIIRGLSARITESYVSNYA